MQEIRRAVSMGTQGKRTLLRNTVEADLILQCFSLKVTVTEEEDFKVTEYLSLSN